MTAMLSGIRTRGHLMILALSILVLALVAFDAATALHVFSAIVGGWGGRDLALGFCGWGPG